MMSPAALTLALVRPARTIFPSPWSAIDDTVSSWPLSICTIPPWNVGSSPRVVFRRATKPFEAALVMPATSIRPSGWIATPPAASPNGLSPPPGIGIVAAPSAEPLSALRFHTAAFRPDWPTATILPSRSARSNTASVSWLRAGSVTFPPAPNP